MKPQTLFEGSRMTTPEAIALTVESLNLYRELYDHWVIAYSGGKDSTDVVTLVAHLIETGQIKPPETLKVLYADTRMEIPPLQMSAFEVIKELKARGYDTEIVTPELDKRFFVYMLGRGVPPPSNTFRWCTDGLKIQPMFRAMERHSVALGFGEMVEKAEGKFEYQSFDSQLCKKDEFWSELQTQARKIKFQIGRAKTKNPAALPDLERSLKTIQAGLKARERKIITKPRKILTLTGVRLGESAARDERIALSCSKDGAECGQGWLQTTTSEHLSDTLAPILHWRVCLVWDWLMGFVENHRFDTRKIAEVYGVYEDGSEFENATRTGCIECNLASQDIALLNLLKIPYWAYFAPLAQLKAIYAEMKKPEFRLRKWGEINTDGSLAKNQGRLGPLVLDSREYFLDKILQVQRDVNAIAVLEDKPEISLINDEELARIYELIKAGVYPDKWDGTEMRGDEMTDKIYRDGTIQPFMFNE